MWKIPAKTKAVVSALSPCQQKAIPDLLASHKLTCNWTLLIASHTGRSGSVAGTTRSFSLYATPSTAPPSSSPHLARKPHLVNHHFDPLPFRRHLAMAPWSGIRAAEELRNMLQESDVPRDKKLVAEGNDVEEDYTGVGQRLAKLERHISLFEGQADRYVEPSDSECEDDDRFWPEHTRKRERAFNRRCQEHADILRRFAVSETLDEALQLMSEIEEFEQKHFKLPLEYRVIGEMMNRMKEATGKERFMLIQKLNKAVRLAERRIVNDPNNPVNYGIFAHRGDSQAAGRDSGRLRLAKMAKDEDEGDDDSESKGNDEALLEKLNAIDKVLEEKLAMVDQTFGRKGKALQEEIKELAQERYALTTEKRTPLRRKGFDVKLIDVNRTSRVTKGGRLFKFKVILACGNYDGIFGFAKGKGPKINDAINRAHEKCFENLHYVERYEDHTIAHAVQAKYGRTKIYLWPARTTTGVVAGRIVETILLLAGYKNIKSKVVGSRNAYNTVKALFQALNAIETPKDVQEKFGRTVVESYLL